MLNRIYKTLPFLTLLVAPMLVLAQTPPLNGTTSFFTQAEVLVRGFLVPLVFTLALLFFFYGVAKYIWSEGQGKEDGRKIMIWGVVALFVMSSIWAIVFFISSELGIKGFQPASGTMKIPAISTE